MQLQRSLGIILSLLTAACFALLPLFMLPLLKEGITVPAIMAYRFLIGSLMLLGILLSRK